MRQCEVDLSVILGILVVDAIGWVWVLLFGFGIVALSFGVCGFGLRVGLGFGGWFGLGLRVW